MSIGDHHAHRRALHDFARALRVESRCAGVGLLTIDAQQKLRPAFLPKHHARDGAFAGRLRKAGATHFDAARGHCHAQTCAQVFDAFAVKQIHDFAAHQTAVAVFDQGLRAQIGVEHFVVVGIDQQDGLAAGVKQDAIARFGVTQSHKVALHRLLGFHQTPLQNRQGFKIATHQQHLPLGAQRKSGVLNRHVGRTGYGVIDVSPHRFMGLIGCGDDFGHFGAALRGHHLDPRLTEPLLASQNREFRSQERNILHHRLGIDQNRDVAGFADQARKCIRFERGKFHGVLLSFGADRQLD